MAEQPEERATWLAEFDERERKHVLFALKYTNDYAHGAPGHLDLTVIAKLARRLCSALGQAPPEIP